MKFELENLLTLDITLYGGTDSHDAMICQSQKKVK